MKKFLTAAAIGAMMTAGAAAAMDGPAPAAPTAPKAAMKTITKADMLSRADARFDRLDTNKDGYLNAAELAAGKRGGKMDRMHRPATGPDGKAQKLGPADANGDGLISKAEHRAAAEARFSRMDTNKNGVLERGEGRGGKGHRMGNRGGHHGGKHFGRGGPGFGPAGGMMMFADANKDGTITRAEFDAHNAKMFERLDANKDGKIDKSELRAPRKPGAPRPAPASK